MQKNWRFPAHCKPEGMESRYLFTCYSAARLRIGGPCFHRPCFIGSMCSIKRLYTCQKSGCQSDFHGLCQQMLLANCVVNLVQDFYYCWVYLHIKKLLIPAHSKPSAKRIRSFFKRLCLQLTSIVPNPVKSMWERTPSVSVLISFGN